MLVAISFSEFAWVQVGTVLHLLMEVSQNKPTALVHVDEPQRHEPAFNAVPLALVQYGSGAQVLAVVSQYNPVLEVHSFDGLHRHEAGFCSNPLVLVQCGTARQILLAKFCKFGQSQYKPVVTVHSVVPHWQGALFNALPCLWSHVDVAWHLLMDLEQYKPRPAVHLLVPQTHGPLFSTFPASSVQSGVEAQMHSFEEEHNVTDALSVLYFKKFWKFK